MLDLNIDFQFSGETDLIAAAGDADSVTSTTTADELDSNISAINFSILREKIEVVDNERSEMQLFPAADRANYWLNLSATEVSGVLKGSNQVRQGVAAKKSSRRGPRSKSSQYRGVTFYRRTGRWESHIWDCGKQVYLGGFDTAHAAARAYDRAAVKFRGVDADINFNIIDYEEDMKQMNNLTKEEFIQILRRHSNGLSRGSSKCRGMTMQKFGRWEPQMGQFLCEKVNDKGTIVYNQGESLTNTDPSSYKREINSIGIDEGSDLNLDLNLGISLASHGPQRTYTTETLHFPYAYNESPDGKIVKVHQSLASSYGPIMTAKYAPMVGGIYSGFASNSKERAMAMSAEAIPFPGFPNWPWKMQSRGVVNTVPLLSSAASSGFYHTIIAPHSNSLVSSTSAPQFPASAFSNLLDR